MSDHSVFLSIRPYWLIALLVLIWISKHYRTLRQDEQRRQDRCCQRPQKYPHKDKLFGLDLLWKCTKAVRKHSFLHDHQVWVTNIADTFEYLMLGNKAIVTIDPTNIKAILSAQFTEFGLGEPRTKALQPLFGNGIFNSEGQAWHDSRQVLRPHLAKPTEQETAIFEYGFQSLLRHIPSNNASVDMQDLFSWLTLDTATKLFLGKSSDILSSTTKTSPGKQFAEAFDYLQIHISGVDDLSITGILKSLFTKSRFRSCLSCVEQYVNRLIEAATEHPYSSDMSGVARENQTGITNSTLLQTLISQSRTREEINTEILNVLLAGKDTTKTLMSNVWFILARRPDVYTKLRLEVATLQGQTPTASQLQKLTYLRCIIKETLRLYPPVALNQRTAMVDTTIPYGAGTDGKSPLFVSRGTSVGYNVYAMHRREDVFGLDAEEFRPERWQDPEFKPGWAYMPFHRGPRKCPGQRLAMTQVAFITVRLAQHFAQVTADDERPWVEQLGLNCVSRFGAKMSFSTVEPIEQDDLL